MTSTPLFVSMAKDLGLALLFSIAIGIGAGVAFLGCVEHMLDNAADAASALVEDGSEIAH
jgi:hypothetical protein